MSARTTRKTIWLLSALLMAATFSPTVGSAHQKKNHAITGIGTGGPLGEQAFVFSVDQMPKGGYAAGIFKGTLVEFTIDCVSVISTNGGTAHYLRASGKTSAGKRMYLYTDRFGGETVLNSFHVSRVGAGPHPCGMDQSKSQRYDGLVLWQAG